MVSCFFEYIDAGDTESILAHIDKMPNVNMLDAYTGGASLGWLDACHNKRRFDYMNKARIIKEIIGKRINPYGFQYVKAENLCWIFLREVRGITRYHDPDNDVVKQYISIEESRYDKMVIVRIATDAYGGDIELEEKRKYGIEKWVDYTDEESYKNVLNQFADLIEKYGFDLLDQMSREDEIIPTKAMEEELIQNHKELDRQFVEEFHIKTVPGQMSDIEEWRESIIRILRQYASKSYGDVKELLIRMAAFMGERSCELCSLKWMENIHSVGGRYPYPTFSTLVIVVNLWKCGCDEQKMYLFDTICMNSWKQGFLEKEGQG